MSARGGGVDSLVVSRFIRAIKSLIIRYSQPLNERAVKAGFTWMINRV